MGLYLVFNRRKNGAKTLIILLCSLHLILCFFFSSSPARTGILLFWLRINRHFDRRVVESIREDFFFTFSQYNLSNPGDSCGLLLFLILSLCVPQHGFQCCSQGTVSRLVPKTWLDHQLMKELIRRKFMCINFFCRRFRPKLGVRG